jgi:CheY-like chemotaxis protein
MEPKSIQRLVDVILNLREPIPSTPMRVLIVEDEALTGLALSMALEAEGHEIVGLTHTSRQAQKLCELDSPEVAFVDIDLEEKGAGLLLAARLHRHGCAVIFTTGRPELARTCDSAIGLMSKPYDCRDAAHAIRVAEWLRRGETPPSSCVPNSLELLSGASFAKQVCFEPILLVEDHPIDAELAMAALQKCRVLNPVVLARDGIQALEYLDGKHNARRPALVLLDIKMPRMNGLEVLKHLRQHPHLRSVRVVMLTASQHESDVRHCYAHGASDYLVKPTSLEGLATELGRLQSYLSTAEV